MEKLIRKLYTLKNDINYTLECGPAIKFYRISVICETLEAIRKIEGGENLFEDFYNKVKNCKEHEIDEIIKETNIQERIKNEIEKYLIQCYGYLYMKHEAYKMKAIMWYENEYYQKIITFMAGSFYNDQEFRTFMANIQKGIGNIDFSKVGYSGRIFNLRTLKNGYVAHVKRALDQNTQDGYHAFINLYNDRFFLLREDDSPVDAVYNWIIKNTQAAVLEDWKTYLYNKISEGGYIKECECINYTNTKLKGIVLSEEVNTELIRRIRKEGLATGEISIPREPVEIDESMSFLDVMNQYIIPAIEQKETRYKLGDPFSPLIEKPIIYRSGNKIKKSYLYPKQKVIVQGIINAVKAGKHSIVLNGGMGLGKTYMAITSSYAILRECFKKDSGRIAVYCQSHLIPKWERQFKEALSDVKLKFIKINGYKDVVNLKKEKPQGIEVYLLPKDKVKRKYLEEYAPKLKYNLSLEALNLIEKYSLTDTTDNFIKANNIKMSELKVVAKKLEKIKRTWICLYKEIVDEKGNVVGYKVATTSDKLKEIFGDTHKAYNFIVIDLKEIEEHRNEIEEEYKNKEKSINLSNIPINGLICPECGGFIYEKWGEQFSADDCTSNIFYKFSTKNETNKKCKSYIKADGTPLMTFEWEKIIKNEIEYFVVKEGENYAYYDEDKNPITDQETLIKIKSGYYDKPYMIALKKCNTPHWTVEDRKGYRTVNSVDMLRRKFGKDFFSLLIADECHLYSAESSQGETFGKLCRMSKIKLALTGTLTGGKASHLFYLLYRMIPGKISKYYKYNEVNKFIDHYGRRKRVTKEYKNDKYNKSGQGKITSSGWNEIAGISPMLYSHFLSDIMISRKIEDMNYNMPELKFFKHEVELSPELKKGYEKIKQDLLAFMNKFKNVNLGGTYLNTLLSYPDMPTNEPITFNDYVISNPLPMDIENIILPKEQKLIETVKKELRQNRRVIVYVTYTGTKQIDERLKEVLTKEGIKVEILKSSLNTEKREKWIDNKYKEGIEVIITNPKLVQTGLDIIGYPTLYFYEVDYDVRVTRQAESRAWRPNQEKECRVYYAYYKDTIQYDALKLIGSKKKASLALEGVFAEDILSDMGDIGDSGAQVLYKALLGKIKLKEDDLDFFSEEIPEEEIEIVDEKTDEMKEISIFSIPKEVVPEEKDKEVAQLSLFAITEEELKKKSRKEKKKTIIGQLSLFEV